MKHVTPVTVCKAQNNEDEVSQLLEQIFDFVIELVDVKGKTEQGGD